MKLVALRLAAIAAMLLFPCLADGQTTIQGLDVAGKPHPALTVAPAAPSGAEPLATSNLAAPTLSTRIPYYNGQASYSAVAGPLVGDAGTGIVLANYSTNTVSCYIPNPNGTLKPPINSTVTSAPRMVTMADFNGDGLADIAVTNRSTTIGVYFGDGGCGFAQGTPTTLTMTNGTAAQAIGSGIFVSGSNNYSVVVGDRNSSVIQVFVGGGDGGFLAPVSYDAGPAGLDQLVVQDIQGDGSLDIVTTGINNNQVGMVFGNGDGTFGTPLAFPTQSVTSSSLAIGDYNSDGVPDVVVSSGSNLTQRAGMELFPGVVTTTNAAKYLLGTSTFYQFAAGNDGVMQGLVAGDFNGDGFIDVAAACNDSGKTFDGIFIAPSFGRGQLFSTPLLSLPTPYTIASSAPNSPIYPTSSDINGDGYQDLIVPNFNGSATRPNLWVFLSATPTSITPTLGAVFQVAPAPGSLIGSSQGPLKTGSVNCVSQYATFMGALPSRRNIAVQPQLDTTPIWIGGPNVVVQPGGAFSISDAGFTDGGPGSLGVEIAAGGFYSVDVGAATTWQGGPSSGLASNGLYCIKASGAQDGTGDGGWTWWGELP